MANISIPEAALEAGARVQFKNEYPETEMVWEDCNEYEQAEYRRQARATCLAMIEAWEGMAHYRGGWEPVIHNNRKPHLILPLTEKTDDKA